MVKKYYTRKELSKLLDITEKELADVMREEGLIHRARRSHGYVWRRGDPSSERYVENWSASAPTDKATCERWYVSRKSGKRGTKLWDYTRIAVLVARHRK